MSAGQPEFILHGDASQVVSEYFRIEQVVKQVREAMRKTASDTTSDNATVLASLRPLAQEYVTHIERQKQLQQAIRGVGEAQKEVVTEEVRAMQMLKAAAADANNFEKQLAQERIQRQVASASFEERVAKRRMEVATATAAIGTAATAASGGASRFGMAMNQVGFAVSDFMAVSGNMAQRMQSIANNLQMVALAIPGPWGAALQTITLAGQAVAMFSTAMTKGAADSQANGAAVKSLADSYKDFKEDIDRATLSHAEFNKKRREAEDRGRIIAAGEEVEKKREALRGFDWWTPEGKTDTGGFWEGVLRQGGVFGKQVADFATGAPDTDVQRRLLQNEVKNAQIKLDEARKLATQAEEAENKKERISEAEKAIGPAAGKLGDIFERQMAGRGPAAAQAQLQELIAGALPPHLKDIAPEVAKGLAQKATTELEGKRLADRFDGKTPLQKEAEAAERRRDEERIKLEELKVRNRDVTGRASPLAQVDERKMQNFIDSLDVAAKKLRLLADDEKKGQNAQLLGQNPIPPVQPPVNRNGNN